MLNDSGPHESPDPEDAELTVALTAEFRKMQDSIDRAEQLIQAFVVSAIIEPTISVGNESANTFALSIGVRVPPADLLSARLQKIIEAALQDLSDVTASVTEE
jgi:hypothetical protein